jgi:hypothetical protein
MKIVLDPLTMPVTPLLLAGARSVVGLPVVDAARPPNSTRSDGAVDRRRLSKANA